ncbi:MAG: HD domain-containing protein [Thermoanaerobaculaceae bacterium]|jgi:hypothetical protein|nr:HD domain-containing protein [Thermoanaerobaculaceae bacterium]
MKSLPEQARAFATEAHREIGHRRKYTQKPYEVHLKEVAAMVASVTDDPEMIAAAWLHDAVEDTPLTLDEVESRFGRAVARLVEELTDVSRPGDGVRSVRKAIDLAHLERASARAKTIKLADLIDNARDITTHNARFAAVFIPEMLDLLEVLQEGDPTLLERATRLAHRCARELDLPGGRPRIGPGPAEAADSLRRFPVTRSEIRALKRFSRLFGAAQLAQSLRWFDGRDEPARVAEVMRAQGLEVAGILEDGEPVGYLSGAARGDDSIVPQTRPFSPALIVEDDASFADVIQILTRYRWCFVLAYGRVAGVIGRSDLQRPVVRMWLFGLLTGLEINLTRQIESAWPGDAWTPHLPAERLAKTEGLRAERKRRGQNPRLVDCLQLGDKVHLVLNHPGLLESLGAKTRSQAKKALSEIQSLRDNLAHAQDFVEQDWPAIVRLNLRVDEILKREDA